MWKILCAFFFWKLKKQKANSLALSPPSSRHRTMYSYTMFVYTSQMGIQHKIKAKAGKQDSIKGCCLVIASWLPPTTKLTATVKVKGHQKDSRKGMARVVVSRLRGGRTPRRGREIRSRRNHCATVSTMSPGVKREVNRKFFSSGLSLQAVSV